MKLTKGHQILSTGSPKGMSCSALGGTVVQRRKVSARGATLPVHGEGANVGTEDVVEVNERTLVKEAGYDDQHLLKLDIA